MNMSHKHGHVLDPATHSFAISSEQSFEQFWQKLGSNLGLKCSSNKPYNPRPRVGLLPDFAKQKQFNVMFGQNITKK